MLEPGYIECYEPEQASSLLARKHNPDLDALDRLGHRFHWLRHPAGKALEWTPFRQPTPGILDRATRGNLRLRGADFHLRRSNG